MPVFGSTASVEAEIRTGMVWDWKPANPNVTVNSELVTASEQGVRQVWPVEVRASAPAGSEFKLNRGGRRPEPRKGETRHAGHADARASGQAQAADRDGDGSVHSRIRLVLRPAGRVSRAEAHRR